MHSFLFFSTPVAFIVPTIITSHYIGLDVHNVGLWTGKVEAGMLFTCEPGIYIPEENLGIRLEDDLVVTNDGLINLTKHIPIEIEDVEAAMVS